MIILKYRKGELKFYKGFVPKELRKYLKDHPKNKKYVEKFLDAYIYNYVKKEWRKKS